MLEINKKNATELEKMLVEKREALRSFRFSGAGGKTRDVKRGRNIKKDIARILTEINLHVEKRIK
ncbi:50S ribosomal protein L29 [Patescibacteria group bacterium]|nr:50S ribosomal protein L29 [Patescibacteria group bacterium]MBU4057718.1 50S ribosomal protein L29 [Patescibacteria group bacterium]MBU4115736.1 50S ribosomal protein L29 [Patescibacteria group bacterium]